MKGKEENKVRGKGWAEEDKAKEQKGCRVEHLEMWSAGVRWAQRAEVNCSGFCITIVGCFPSGKAPPCLQGLSRVCYLYL